MILFITLDNKLFSFSDLFYLLLLELVPWKYVFQCYVIGFYFRKNPSHAKENL